jgi:hypothetical protein
LFDDDLENIDLERRHLYTLFEGANNSGIDADPYELSLKQLEEILRKDENILERIQRTPEDDQASLELQEKLSEDLLKAMDTSRKEGEKYYLGDLKGIHIQYLDENYKPFLRALHDLEKHILQQSKKELQIPDPQDHVGEPREYLRVQPFLDRKSRDEKVVRGEELLVYYIQSYMNEKISTGALHVYFKRLLDKNGQRYESAKEKLFEVVDDGDIPLQKSGASYSNGKIFYSGIPKEITPEKISGHLDSEYDGRASEILKIFLNTLYRRVDRVESEKFKYTVLHERTHAYLYAEANLGRNKELRAIAEGACQAITYIGTGWSSPPDGYREDKKFQLHILEYSKFAFLLHSDQAESPQQKVQAIRKYAVNVIEEAKARGSIDLAEICTNQKSTEKAHKLIKDGLEVIEETIEISSYSLYLLGQINEQDLREYINRHDIEALIDPESGEINEDLRYKEIHEVVDHATEGVRQYFFPPYIEIVHEYLKSEYRNVEEHTNSNKKLEALKKAVEAWETLESSYSRELEQFSTIENSNSNIEDLHRMLRKNYNVLSPRGGGNRSTDRRKMVRYAAAQNHKEDEVEQGEVKQFPKIQEILGSNQDVNSINIGERMNEVLAKYEKLVKNALEEKNKIIKALEYFHSVEGQILKLEDMKGDFHPASPPDNYDPEKFYEESEKDLKMAKESKNQLKAVLEDLDRVRRESKQLDKEVVALDHFVIE